MIPIKIQKTLMFIPLVNFFTIAIYMCCHKVTGSKWGFFLNFWKGGLIFVGGGVLVLFLEDTIELPPLVGGIWFYISTILICHFLIKYQIKLGVE